MAKRFNGASTESLGPAPHYRVMVVDDEPDIVSVIRQALEKRGFMVDIYTDSALALSAFKPDYYDAVLLDILMPGMDGLQLYDRIRGRDSQVIICFVTAYEHYKRQFEISHPQDETCFITKPMRMQYLIDTVRGKIESRRQGSPRK